MLNGLGPLDVKNCTVSGKLDVLSTKMVIAIKVGTEGAVSFDFWRNITGATTKRHQVAATTDVVRSRRDLNRSKESGKIGCFDELLSWGDAQGPL